MSGRQSSTWRPLPGVDVPGIPGLLVSTDFTAQSYTIHLTDLANVWSESLDKKPIIMRALKEDTSIDPTDGQDQIRRLLDLVRAAFDPSAHEHGDTSLTLSRAGGGTEAEGDDTLTIHVSVVLPKPLRPLKWPIYLKKRPQSAIATELVLPLVHSHQARAREVDGLITALREKDGVIAKLIDKLEATGTGLEHVFTGLAGRREVTRTMAEERIRGLAPFTESDFRNRSETAEREPDGPDDMVTLLRSVFGGGVGLPCGSALDIGDSPALNDWWLKLGKDKGVALASRAKEKGAISSTKGDSQPISSRPAAPTRRSQPDDEGDETEDGDDEDDDFQVQATQPTRRQDHNTHSSTTQAQDDDDEFEVQATPRSRKRDRNTRASRILDDDDETSDGEDAEIPDSVPSATTKETSSKGTAGSRLGTIGGRNKQTSSRQKTPPRPRLSPNPPPPSTRAHPAPHPDDDGSATESEPADEDAMDTTPPPSPPKPSSQQPRRIGGLGRIGGRRAAPAKAATPEPAAPGPASQHTTPKRRLGVIGKKKDPDSGHRGRGRERTTPINDGEATEENVEEEKPRETSQDRADRLRAELKREMERKANAAPAKKKRKF